jgi:hypothetical protein
MIDYVNKIKEKLDIVSLTKEDFNALCKDRLDFGFDSIYFRYSELVEELSWFKVEEARKKGDYNFDRKRWCDTKRMHFYGCLEQLLRAHEPEDK